MSTFKFPFNNKHDTAPFSQIKLEHYKPAFEETITKAKAEIDANINNFESPTFENTNGTAAGTMMVKNITPGNNTNGGPFSLTAVDDLLYFVQSDTKKFRKCTNLEV